MGMAAGVAMGCPGVWLFIPNLFALTQNCIYPIWLFPRVFSFFEFLVLNKICPHCAQSNVSFASTFQEFVNNLIKQF